jgi:hypothetical protein
MGPIQAENPSPGSMALNLRLNYSTIDPLKAF